MATTPEEDETQELAASFGRLLYLGVRVCYYLVAMYVMFAISGSIAKISDSVHKIYVDLNVRGIQVRGLPQERRIQREPKPALHRLPLVSLDRVEDL